MEEEVKFPNLKCYHTFWNTIAFGKFVAPQTKMSRVRNPVLRVTLKLLANTIFARKDTGAVRKDELCLLFQGLKHIVRDENGNLFEDSLGDETNLGCILANELVGFRAWASRTTEQKPQINIGGMITVIAEKVGVDIRAFYQHPERWFLDYDYLVKCGVLRDFYDGKCKTMFDFRFSRSDKVKRLFPMPNHHLTTITSLENIIFLTADHEGLIEQELPPPPERDGLPPRCIRPTPPIDPELPFKPRGKREKFLYKAYKEQRRFAKWKIRMFMKLKRKLKKILGYVSSEDEQELDDEWNAEGEEQIPPTDLPDFEEPSDAEDDMWSDDDQTTLQAYTFAAKKRKRRNEDQSGASGSNH